MPKSMPSELGISYRRRLSLLVFPEFLFKYIPENLNKHFLFQQISSFARDAGTYQSDPDFIPNEVEKIINFEREFARILTPDEDRRNFTKMFGKKFYSN